MFSYNWFLNITFFSKFHCNVRNVLCCWDINFFQGKYYGMAVCFWGRLIYFEVIVIRHQLCVRYCLRECCEDGTPRWSRNTMVQPALYLHTMYSRLLALKATEASKETKVTRSKHLWIADFFYLNFSHLFLSSIQNGLRWGAHLWFCVHMYHLY